MSHHHHHNSETSVGRIKLAFFLNLFFACIELVGGILTNSLAIMSDALHDFGDSVSLGASLYFEKLSQKKKDKKYSYGYKRFSLLGALVSAIVLIIGSVFIIKESIFRLFEPSEPHALGMLGLAIFGVLINGFAVWRMQTGKTVNEKVISWHLLEDVLGWFAVLIGSVIMYFTGWGIIDPILSLGVSLFVLINIYRNIRNCFGIFLQTIPPDVDIKNLSKKISDLDSVESVHDVHIWSLDGASHVLTLHVVLDAPQSDSKKIKQQIREIAHDADIDFVTIEIEKREENCPYISS